MFVFAKELLLVPNDCSQKVSLFNIAVSIVTPHSCLGFRPQSMQAKYLHGCVLEGSTSSRQVSVKMLCKLLT